MEFRNESIEIKIKENIKDMNIITVIHREYRKENTMFFSKYIEYNQLGYVFNNTFHLLKKYMKCINCYSNYDNDEVCRFCQYKFNENKFCFFLNCRNILPTKVYNNLKIKYNLNTINEYYYDQRKRIHETVKNEIRAMALHPERIKKILELTNDSWSNINKYI
jgi:hypothetical protein